MNPEAYKDKFLDMPLLEKEPTAGKVVSTKEVNTDDLEITEMTLSNGVRVILKPTEFQNDQIMLTAYSPGGHSIYEDKDFFSAQYAASIVDEAGLGKFDQIALEKKLTGQTISISPYIGELYEGFSGYSSVEDFETMLKLVYLYATNPRKDKESFERVIADSKEEIKNLGANPMMYFQDQIVKTKNGNHPRRKALPTVEDMNSISYERVYEIYNDRFSDFSDFTFVLVGNFKPEDLKPQLEKYIASLPSKNRKENWKDVDIKYPTKGSNTPLKKGLAPQANVYMGFVIEDEYSPEKAHRVNTMASILNIMVRENLREDKGGVYSPYVGGGMRSLPNGLSDVTVFFQCAPSDVENLIEAVKEEIKSLQEKGPTQENFEKVLETQRRSRESNLEKNRFWMNTLSSYYKTDRSLTDIKGYEKLIESITKEDIQKASKQFLDLDKALILNVKPEKEMPTDGKP
jgi:zinc protease